jgi:CspA family cold shock protein
MEKGTVKFFNRTKNYGFINGDDGKSYFVHSSTLAEGTEIDEDDRVSFDAVEGDKGPKAENVKKLDSEQESEAEEPAEEAAEEAAPEEEQKTA